MSTKQDPARPHLPSLEVAVPCSTSNLGPGFDCLGLALSLWLRVRVAEDAEGPRHELRCTGTAAAWPRDENHLLRAFDRVRGAGRAFRFEVDSEIPLGRGLGSSGAAVAAGLLLGAELAREPLPRDELLRLGFELEGHPDNAVASLVGGCTLAVPHPAGLELVQPELHPELAFAVAWPAGELSTAAARGVLPKQVPFHDAVENPRRLALLLEGLRTARPELLALGGEDRLHVAHRLPLIPGAAQGLEAARAAGAWMATLSGAGSGLFAIGPRERIEGVAASMHKALDGAEPGAEAHVVEAVVGAPLVGPVYGRAKPWR